MNIRNFDLNSLKVLSVLLAEKNTSTTAEILGTSQSSVSRTLSKLREQLDDPILVRESKSLKLTPRGKLLASQLPQLLGSLENALFEDSFHPENLTGTLRIALNGFLMDTFGLKLFKEIRVNAPNVNIELTHFSSTTPNEILIGRVDIALNYFPLEVSKELCQTKVGSDYFLGVVRAGHPLSHTTVKIPEIIDNYDLSGLIVPEFNQYEMKLSSTYKDWNFSPILRAEQLTPLLELTKNTDTIFVAPASYYNTLDREIFSCVKPDIDRVELIDIGVMYNSIYYQSRHASWMIDLMRSVLS